ncbi:MAG: hypothetical protein WCO58_00430 [bacterium]
MDILVYIVGGAVLLWILIHFLYIKNKNKKQNLADIDQEEKVQEQKNRDFISRIIDGNYEVLSDEKKIKTKELFAVWQAFQKKMFREAPAKYVNLRNKYMKDNNLNAFCIDFSRLSPNAGNQVNGPTHQIVIKDAFTEPFPSTIDMDDWAMKVAGTDFMVLNGISKEDSRKYSFHKKEHFVNHEMVQAIIQFDLYKIK